MKKYKFSFKNFVTIMFSWFVIVTTLGVIFRMEVTDPLSILIFIMVFSSLGEIEEVENK